MAYFPLAAHYPLIRKGRLPWHKIQGTVAFCQATAENGERGDMHDSGSGNFHRYR